MKVLFLILGLVFAFEEKRRRHSSTTSTESSESSHHRHRQRKPHVITVTQQIIQSQVTASQTSVPEPPQKLVDVNIKGDNGFYPFNYGPAGTASFQRFLIKTTQWTLLQVTDCFCKGDVFEILDNKNYIGITGIGCADYVEEDCKHPTTNAWECLKGNKGFCHGEAYLRPGKHNITLNVLFSPRNSGSGYLRIDTICQFQGKLIPCCELNGNCK